MFRPTLEFKSLKAPEARVALLTAANAGALGAIENRIPKLLGFKLSPPERAVMLGIAMGFSDKQLIATLGMKPSDLKMHVTMVLRGARVDTREQLAKTAADSLGLERLMTEDAPEEPPGSERPKLTRREEEVLEGVLGGKANKEIASELNLSERTVKFHVSSLLAKFRVRRRQDIVAALSTASPGPIVRGHHASQFL
jgi:DNA-binding NarL/FixJ family response regulator